MSARASGAARTEGMGIMSMTGKEAEVWLSAMTHLVHGKDREAIMVGLDALKSALYDDTPPAGGVASPYGICPRCGAPGFSRERRVNGYDTCNNGHTYLSSEAIQMPAWGGSDSRLGILWDVVQERLRQDAKWGEQNHDPFTWLTILVEEVGEVAQCALHSRFGGPEAANMRTEAVQVAAVALAIIQCLDRGKWSWPGK